MRFQFNQAQKLDESTVNPSTTLSSMTLSSSRAPVPTTSSSFATDTIIKQLPVKESSTHVLETVALNQKQNADITFSFKNLDVPSTAKNDISSQKTDSCTNTTPNRSDYVSHNLLST